MNGLLLVDKPKGLTSHDVVGQLRKVLNQKAVGHAGTLDPMATGLLVILLGEATKLSDYMRSAEKAYELEVRLGLTTDSWDADGQVLKLDSISLDPELIAAEARRMQGALELSVPAFSAVKRQGQKLYEKARRQEDIDLPQRVMEFYDLKLKEVEGHRLSLSLKCSKGSYIRSWAHALGERLQVGGTLVSLRRTASQPYDISKASSLTEITAQWQEAETLPESSFIPLDCCLPGWKALTVQGRDERLMKHGQIPKNLAQRLIFEQKQANQKQTPLGIKILSGGSGELLSLLEAQPFKGLKIRRIFNSQAR